MSQFNLISYNGIRFVRRSPTERYSPQCTKSSIKFRGGSVWHDFYAGTGPLVRLHGKINTVYKDILKKLVPNLRTENNQPVVFKRDNAPYHTAESVNTFLSEVNVIVMECPAQSPDMNHIEKI